MSTRPSAAADATTTRCYGAARAMWGAMCDVRWTLMTSLARSPPSPPHPPCVALRASFLRARRFDVEKAKQMLLDCEQWRRDFGVDDLVA